jgi:KDO2-lipid IV(A) lauroyltransferase
MKINSFLFRYLPFAISRGYIICLGRLYYLLHRREQRLIRQTIDHVFKSKLAAPTRRQKSRETFTGIFDHYHEKLFVAYSNFPRLLRFLRRRIRFAGAASLQAALDRGNGVILVTGHFGAVEFLPGFLAVSGYPVSMICRFQTDRLRRSLRQRAKWVGLDLIDADDGKIILKALSALKQGRILITECDEFEAWRPDPNRHNSLLNLSLPADRTLELLQKRSGAAILTAFMHRGGPRTYTCKLTPIAEQARAGFRVSEQCLQHLEMALEYAPDQWYQWKKFGKLIQSRLAAPAGREPGGLAPDLAISGAEAG